MLLQFNAEGREIPVVFISAYVDDPTRRLAMQAGAIAFLQKPFEEEALLRAVEQAKGCSRDG